jgi:Microtubule-associated protein CRIPT
MVCQRCESLQSGVAAAAVFRDHKSDTTGVSAGRRVNENKVLSGRSAARKLEATSQPQQQQQEPAGLAASKVQKRPAVGPTKRVGPKRVVGPVRGKASAGPKRSGNRSAAAAGGSTSCRLCNEAGVEPGHNYCQRCAHRRGICGKCGIQLDDASAHRGTQA